MKETRGVQGLRSDEAYVLKVVCEWLIERDNSVIEARALLHEGAVGMATERALIEALERLVGHGYFAPARHGYRVTGVGFGRYLRAFYDGFEDVIRRVAAAVVTDELRASDLIAWKIGVPHPVVVHVLSEFDAARHVRLGGLGADVARIVAVFPSLRIVAGAE